MDYAILTLDLPDDLAEVASALLHDRGALGVEVRDGEAVPPGARPPAAGRAEVSGYFEGAVAVDGVAQDLVAILGPDRVLAHTGRCREEDWAESWKRHFSPIHLGGRLWVVPPWEPRPPGPCRV